MKWLATARKDRCQEAVVADHYQMADHQRTLLVDGRAHHQEDHQDQDRHQEDEGSMEGVCFPTVSCILVSS